MNRLTALTSGALFGVGLVVSAMTDPDKVIGFLDLGNWDPSLALVMVGAIAVHAVSYRLMTRMSSPLFAAQFSVPSRTSLDGRLVVGSALFGMGWGLGGYCPGPGLVALGGGGVSAVLFVGGLLGGFVLFEWVLRVRPAVPATES